MIATFQKPLLGQQVNQAHILKKKLVACWPMNEQTGDLVIDYSGNGYDGTIVNNVIRESSELGPVLHFGGGASDYINCEDKDLFTPTSSGFSVIGRFKADTIPPSAIGNRMWIIAKGAASNYEWGVSINDYNSDYGNLVLSNWNAGGSGTRRRSATTIVANTWYGFAFTLTNPRDGILADCYINGILDNGTDFSNATADTVNLNAPLLIGARGDFAENEFDGFVSEIFIHNYVLTAEEVALYSREPFIAFKQDKMRWFFVGGTARYASIFDGIGVTDVVTKVGTYVRSNSEAVEITDVLLKVGTFIRLKAESVGIADTLSTALNKVVSFVDAVGITDVLSKSVGRIVILADSTGITDMISKIGTFIRSITDSINITDVISKIGTFIRSKSDSVGITDVINTSASKVVSLVESIGIADVISAIVATMQRIQDSFGKPKIREVRKLGSPKIRGAKLRE